MTCSYAGDELHLFLKARRWKAYWSAEIGPFISGKVLEVGAGVGANIPYLQVNAEAWVSLEPDYALAKCIAGGPMRGGTVAGTIESIKRQAIFDTVLYIDVLEHIPDDKAELRRAAQRLRAGGRIVVLAPAYMWLYSEFDAAIGHHRRYTRGSLSAITPPGTRLVALKYLDLAGVLASLVNRLLLRSPRPTPGQLRVWDRFLVPTSRYIDRWTGYRAGRSVIAVWESRP